MNFGDPKPKTLPNQPPDSIEVVNEGMRQKAEAFTRPLVQELLQQATAEPDKKLFAVEQIATSGKRIFQGHEDILDAALEKIKAVPFTSDEEFEEILVKELGNAVLAFVASSGFSEREAKIYFRCFREEREGNTPLDADGVLSYSRFEEKIDLHITDGFTIPLFREDMSKLAEIVRADESIKTIKMTSWVVAKYKNVVRKFGFTLDEPLSEAVLVEIRSQLPPEMADKPIAEAHMTREKFLEKFGQGEQKSEVADKLEGRDLKLESFLAQFDFSALNDMMQGVAREAGLLEVKIVPLDRIDGKPYSSEDMEDDGYLPPLYGVYRTEDDTIGIDCKEIKSLAERMGIDPELLTHEALIHEEVHAATKQTCYTSFRDSRVGYKEMGGELFRLWNEGVTELFAQDLF